MERLIKRTSFEGKELVATQLTGADADYVQLQEVGADKIGEKDAYFGLDTTKYTIAGQKDVFGYKFAKTQLGWIMVIIQY